MGAFLTLIATCVVMFVAAMGAGMVPLHQATLLPSLGSQSSIMSSSSTSMPIDAKNLAVVSAVGAGLLISTALAVVVPEGFHLLAAIERKAAVVIAVEEEHESMSSSSGHEHHSSHSDHSSGHSGHSGGGDALPHWLPGLALASGFFFMMGLDALSASSSAGHHSCGGGGGGGARSIATAEGGGGAAPAAATAPPTSSANAPPTSSAAASGALRALVVHAAADGLAVGASCAATATATGPGAQTLAWSVAAAMALHKAPAAFGLSATLASAGWGQLRARRGLLFFSLSSPVAALATFFALLIFGGGREHAAGGSGSGLGVAAALLFSGGTLVHAAAVHVLPSVAPRLGFSSSSSDSSEEDEASARVRYALVAGAAAPLILSALAPHEH